MNNLIQEIHMVFHQWNAASFPATIPSTHVPLSWNATGIETRSTAWAAWSAGVWMQPGAIRSKVCHSEQQEREKVIALMLIVLTHKKEITHSTESNNIGSLEIRVSTAQLYHIIHCHFELKWTLEQPFEFLFTWADYWVIEYNYFRQLWSHRDSARVRCRHYYPSQCCQICRFPVELFNFITFAAGCFSCPRVEGTQ